DTCVCVRPEGREQLGRLTMIIMGFAATKRQTDWERSWLCNCDACQPPRPTNASSDNCNQSQILADQPNPFAATAVKPPSCMIIQSTVIGDSGKSGSKGSSGSDSNSLLIAQPAVAIP